MAQFAQQWMAAPAVVRETLTALGIRSAGTLLALMKEFESEGNAEVLYAASSMTVKGSTSSPLRSSSALPSPRGRGRRGVWKTPPMPRS